MPGRLIERCLSTPLSGKTSFEHVFDGVRAVGLQRNFFSSDFGNPDYPPVVIPRDPSLVLGTVLLRWCTHGDRSVH